MGDRLAGGPARALVSAVDAPSLWDLRCLAREHLATWTREQAAVPRTRAELEEPIKTHIDAPVTVHPHARRDGARTGDRVFSGNARANARGDEFGGPRGTAPSD